MASDIDIRATITTTADNSGAESATAAINTVGETADKAAVTTTQGAEQTSEAVDKVGESAVTAAEEVTTAMEAVTDAAKEVETTTRRAIDGMTQESAAAQQAVSTTAKEAVAVSDKVLTAEEELVRSLKAQIAQLTDEIANSPVELGLKLDELKRKQAALGTDAPKTANSVTTGLEWMRSGWVKVAQAAGGVFGAIGLVNQAISLGRQAWEWWRKDAVAAAAAAEESMRRVEARVKTTYDALMASRIAASNAAIGQAAADDARAKQLGWEAEIEAVKAINSELMRQQELQAALAGNEAERIRLVMERQLYEGKISQAEYDRLLVDQEFSAKQAARDKARLAAQAQYDDAAKEEAVAVSKVKDTSGERDSILGDKRYMSEDDLARNYADIAQAERNLTEAKVRYDKLAADAASAWAKQDRLIPGTDDYNAATDNANKLQGYVSDEATNIGSLKAEKKELETKRYEAGELRADKGFIGEGENKRFYASVAALGDAVREATIDLQRKGVVTTDASKRLDDVDKIQKSEEQTDRLARSNAESKIKSEEQKQKAEESATEIQKLTDSMEVLATQAAAAKDKLAELRKEEVAKIEATGAKGKMVDNIKGIAGRDNLDNAAEAELRKYIADLSNSRDQVGSKTVIKSIKSLIANFKEVKNSEEEVAETLKQGKMELSRKKRSTKVGDTQDYLKEIYASVYDEVARKERGGDKGTGKAVDKTKSLIRDVLKDGQVDDKELPQLNSLLAQWIANQRAVGSDPVNTAMIAALREVVGLQRDIIPEFQRTVKEVGALRSEVKTLQSQFRKK